MTNYLRTVTHLYKSVGGIFGEQRQSCESFQLEEFGWLSLKNFEGFNGQVKHLIEKGWPRGVKTQEMHGAGTGLAGGTGREEGREGQVRETASECNTQGLLGQQATVMCG